MYHSQLRSLSVHLITKNIEVARSHIANEKMLITPPWLPLKKHDRRFMMWLIVKLIFSYAQQITWHDSKIMMLSVISEISLIAEFNRKNVSIDFYLFVAVDLKLNLNQTYRKAISPSFTSRIIWLIEHTKVWSLKLAVQWKLSWAYTPLAVSRTVRLRECSLRELPPYFSNTVMCTDSLKPFSLV